MVRTDWDTNEKHGKYRVKEGFHLSRGKLDRLGAEWNECIGVRCLLLFEMKNWN